MAFGTRVQFEALRSVAFGSITNSYTAVGAATTDHTRWVCLSNGTNADMFISLDGSTDHLRIPANGFKLIDIVTNKVTEDGYFIDVGTIFYIKYASVPTSGTFWIEVMFAAGGV